MTQKTKKYVVLFVLFIFPLILYLILSTGINNFARLPVLTQNVSNVKEIDRKKVSTFTKKISVVCFLGRDIRSVQGGFFNLNEKIYKPFLKFNDFQVIAIYPEEVSENVKDVKTKLGKFTDMRGWNFVPSSSEEIKVLFKSFRTNLELKNLYSSHAFIIDKELNLRGRLKDKDAKGKLYGYNMESVAELSNKMKDDIKIVLAEYRLALKKNDADRKI